MSLLHPPIDGSTTEKRKPLWSVVNDAIKTGQKHPSAFAKRKAIGEVLETEDLPGVHAGVLKILNAVRGGSQRILERLDARRDHHLTHTILSAYFTERAWSEAERDGPLRAPFAENFQKAYLRSRDTKHLRADPFAADAKNVGERAFEKLRSVIDQDEQFQTGINAEIMSIKEIVRVLALRYAWDAEEWEEPLKTNAHDEIFTIGRRSVPPTLHALSSLHRALHEQVVCASAVPEQKPRGRTQNRSHEQDPTQFEFIADPAGGRVLTTRAELYAIVPQCIHSYGCPAKFAKAADGQSVTAAFAERILGHWKTEYLPLLVEGGTKRKIHHEGLWMHAERLKTLR
jgi:hypothetical protein